MGRAEVRGNEGIGVTSLSSSEEADLSGRAGQGERWTRRG